MLKAVRRSSWIVLIAVVCSLALSEVSLAAESATTFKKHDNSLSRDIFEQNFYYEATSYLRLDRLYRALFRKKARSKNVNVFDEVPDSTFFTNRHSRQALSVSDLTKGYQANEGSPDLSGKLTITRGKFEGVNPGFFVKDGRGDEYLIKFDPADYLGMETASEVVGSRFYYALGYNVPEVHLIKFEPSQLVPGEGAKIVDSTGFKKLLTQEKLDEFLLFIPSDEEGRFLASASKVIEGDLKNGFMFQGRRRNDPDDPFNHEDRREIRALQVFGSWLNNMDIRRHNTMDVVVQENGRPVLKHYLIDFNSSLGSAVHNAKPPMFGHEHMFDFGETLKAIFGLGIWEKPWQRRWREAGEKVEPSAVGYFDNRGFDPAKFKTQLPHYAFKDLTRADGFWASKIIMTFTDSDIEALVKSGNYTNPDDAAAISKILLERRDIVAKHWFSQSSPLDKFDVSGGNLVFEDLAVKYGFETQENTSYLVEVIGKNGKRGKKLTSLKLTQPSLPLEDAWFSGYSQVDFLIRAVRGNAEPLPFVLVELDGKKVAGVTHQD